jgi:hypothetical protein
MNTAGHRRATIGLSVTAKSPSFSFVGLRGFQWVESSEFQLFGRTSKEIAGGNNEWLGARYRLHAVAVAIPFLVVRSLPLPEAVTPFPNRA